VIGTKEQTLREINALTDKWETEKRRKKGRGMKKRGYRQPNKYSRAKG
jgi:hypothetical protein